MKNNKHISLALAAFLFAFCATAHTAVAASTVTTDFESATPPVTVNGYNGWSVVNSNLDQAIVANTYGFPEFGSNVWRISNKTTGGFSDQPFSASTLDEAGETTATNNGLSGGTRQNHFEATFDIASASLTEQVNVVEVSLDRGDGSRMADLDFEDYSGDGDGIKVWYYGINPITFNTLEYSPLLKVLRRDQVYTFKIVADFIEGYSNDVVKIYIDDELVYTGTTWENYYRFIPGQGGATRTVDSLIFKPVVATPASEGKGFLFDNIALYSGPAYVPDTEITVEDPELVIDEGSEAVDIVVPQNVEAPTLNLAALQTGLSVETPVNIAVSTETSKGLVAVSIPSGTTITGGVGWNGVIHLPQISTVTITPAITSRQRATVDLVVDIGATQTLTFDSAVRLTLPGQAGKKAGYSYDGGTTFTEITTACVAGALPDGANECIMDSGSDLLIVTNHFTLFATYSVATVSSGGSRVIGSVGPRAGSTTTTEVVTETPPTSIAPVVTTPITPTETPTAAYNFTALMKVGTRNTDVAALQKLLTAKAYGTLTPDGIFGPMTQTALKAFQTANGLVSDGIAGPLTRAALNK